MHENSLKPLNGTKTHPLTAAALSQLRDIGRSARPRSEINPGVANRLLREALVASIQAPSPFATHRGRDIEHLRITDAGLAALADGQARARASNGG